MNRISVESEAIRSVGFDVELNVLELEFAGSTIFRYFGVPRSLFRSLLEAESKGAFVNREIVPRFPNERIA